MKAVIITGASSGIGRALAYRFAEAGYHLTLAARDESALQDIANDITQKFGVKTWVQVTDVTRKEDCRRLVEAHLAAFGRLDVLINNAGISMRALFRDVEPEVLEQLMQVNFWGAVYCTKYALEALLKSKGSIVGVSSIAGYRGLPERAGYSASKFALNGFLESLRTELLYEGVHVLTACPGFTQSNIRKKALNATGGAQAESPRNEAEMMSAEEVAEHIYRAVVRRKRTLILTRIGKLTVFFNKWLPAWLDKQVYKEFARERKSGLS